jgi:hypothetical protein
MQDTLAERIQLGAAISEPFDQFNPTDLSFTLARVLLQELPVI